MKAILAILAVLGIDLSSKEWAEKNLPLNKKREIVKDHLYFWHIKNRGIAYNRFSGRRKGILLATGALLAFYGGLLVRILRGKGERRHCPSACPTFGRRCGKLLGAAQKRARDGFFVHPCEGEKCPDFQHCGCFDCRWCALDDSDSVSQK